MLGLTPFTDFDSPISETSLKRERPMLVTSRPIYEPWTDEDVEENDNDKAELGLGRAERVIRGAPSRVTPAVPPRETATRAVPPRETATRPKSRPLATSRPKRPEKKAEKKSDPVALFHQRKAQWNSQQLLARRRRRALADTSNL